MSGDTSLEELRRVVFYEEEAARLCPSCRQTAAAEYHFCPHCGHTITASCLKCDRRVDASWAFCPGCGTRRTPSVVADLTQEPLVPAAAEPLPAPRTSPLAPVAARRPMF